MEPVYGTVISLVRTGFRACGWRIEVQGAQHIPRAGPAVLASNHIGYLDFTFVGYGARARRRVVRFLAKQEIFDKRGVGWLMRKMRHIPVDRYGRAVEAFGAAVKSLKQGELVGMFPESTISRSFVPMAGKTGAVRMAMAADVPLIPCVVWGSQRLLTKGRRRNLQRGVAIVVAFGEPLAYQPDEEPVEVTKRLMARIADLLEAAQADYPQQPASDADRWWLPAHLGGTAPTVAEADALTARESAERRARRRAAAKQINNGGKAS
ncbi:MAG: 1-acyl-sn-glycerol-3-phosphate acyltransferase [Nitriliruptorales bacterium]|nr:1-acyl-sn-glycerol-3-phosphate acyltransferase [Nitriliruptorales bacterium]